MFSPLHAGPSHHLVQDRIADLYATAGELHTTRRDGADPAGLFERARWSIGRRLITIGCAVAGQHA